MDYSDALRQIKHSDRRHIGLKMDMTTIFGFITLVGPFFIMFMMFTLSIFNSNFKGFVYLIGVSIMYFFISILNKSGSLVDTNETLNEYHFPFCQLFGNEQYYSIPSFNSSLYIFTLFYLLLPMIKHNMFNLPLVIFFVLLFGLDVVTRTIHINCTTHKGVALGALIGFVWSIIYYNILSQNNTLKEFLYYNDHFDSNKVACMRPSQQKFKCAVYKNGELVESI